MLASNARYFLHCSITQKKRVSCYKEKAVISYGCSGCCNTCMQIGCEFCMTMYQFFVVQYFARGSETLYTYT